MVPLEQSLPIHRLSHKVIAVSVAALSEMSHTVSFLLMSRPQMHPRHFIIAMQAI